MTATKRTALNGTNEIDEVVTDYAKIHFEPCMPFDPKLSFEHEELRPGQGSEGRKCSINLHTPNVYSNFLSNSALLKFDRCF